MGNGNVVEKVILADTIGSSGFMRILANRCRNNPRRVRVRAEAKERGSTKAKTLPSV